MLIGSWQSTTRLVSNGAITFGTYILAFSLLLLTLAGTLVFMIWGVGVWLMRLTAFAHAFLELPLDTQLVEAQTIKDKQASAIESVKSRRAYLAQYWLLVSIFLGVPFFIVGALTIVKVLAITPIYGQLLFSLSPLANAIVLALLSFLLLIVTEVSLLGLVVSAVSNLPAATAAKETIKLSAQLLLPGLALSIFAVAICVVISSPQVLFHLNNPSTLFSMQGPVSELLLESGWQGVTSVVLWTFTTAPFCELLRGKVR